MRAQFAMVEMNYKHNIIFIEDIANHTGGTTITNDAEAVFKHIDENYSHAAPTPMYWRVVYKDTDNEWWEMIREDHPWEGHVISFERWNGLVWDALKGNV